MVCWLLFAFNPAERKLPSPLRAVQFIANLFVFMIIDGKKW